MSGEDGNEATSGATEKTTNMIEEAGVADNDAKQTMAASDETVGGNQEMYPGTKKEETVEKDNGVITKAESDAIDDKKNEELPEMDDEVSLMHLQHNAVWFNWFLFSLKYQKWMN